MRIIAENINKYSDSTEYDTAYELVRALDPHRAERIDRNSSEVNKRRLLTAGMLVSNMCERLHIDNPVTACDEHGKPYIEGHPGVYFNLSHSGDYAAIAYGDRPVGLDIQEKRRVTESFGRRILNEAEYGLCDISDAGMICGIWTIKEAYSKLLGLGLAYDFRDCVIDAAHGRITDINGRFKPACYKRYSPQKDMYMALTFYDRTDS